MMLQVYSVPPCDFTAPPFSVNAVPPNEDTSAVDLLGSIESNGLEIKCCIDNQTGRKLLNCSGTNMYSCSQLAGPIPENTDATVIAKSINYLLNGMNSHVITDPSAFQKKYEELRSIDLTQMPILLADRPLCICQREHYDTSIIKQPRIEDGVLEFYVDMDCIPYKITCEWPVREEIPTIKQETLPLSEENLFS